jgi:putative membrane protein
VLLADMMDEGGHNGGNGWGWVVVVLLVLLVIAVTVLLVRHFGDSGRGAGRRGAEDLLDERFARGEIDEDEYRKRRDALRR